MKLVCKQCGAHFQTDNDVALAEKLLSSHVAKEHGSIETKFAEVLAKSRDVMEGLTRGIKPSRKDARVLFDEISSLTGKPLSLPEESEEEKEKSDESIVE